MELLEVPVEKLAFGMFISKLDRPWTETPFAFQGFVLQKDKQLEVLRKYCKHVFVDPEKAVVQDVAKVTAKDSSAPNSTVIVRAAVGRLLSLTRRGVIKGRCADRAVLLTVGASNRLHGVTPSRSLALSVGKDRNGDHTTVPKGWSHKNS